MPFLHRFARLSGEMKMKELLDLHNVIMRDVIRKHNGYEVKTEGDAFMVAFQHASDGTSNSSTTVFALIIVVVASSPSKSS